MLGRLGLRARAIGLGLRARARDRAWDRARAYRFIIMKLSNGLPEFPVAGWDRSRRKGNSSNLPLELVFFPLRNII